MSAGGRSELLNFLTATVTKTSGGENVNQWSALAKVWARPDRPAAREAIKRGVIVGPMGITFVLENIGAVTAVTEEDRVIWLSNGNKMLVVKGVTYLGETHRDLSVQCEELKPGEYGVMDLDANGDPVLDGDGNNTYS